MKNKIFLFFGLTFFVFFAILLLAESQGYYKNRNEKAKTLTEEQIKEFEEDIKEGKDIDIKKYTNNISNNIYKISLKLEGVVDDAIKMIFNGASTMVND